MSRALKFYDAVKSGSFSSFLYILAEYRTFLPSLYLRNDGACSKLLDAYLSLRVEGPMQGPLCIGLIKYYLDVVHFFQIRKNLSVKWILYYILFVSNLEKNSLINNVIRISAYPENPTNFQSETS